MKKRTFTKYISLFLLTIGTIIAPTWMRKYFHLLQKKPIIILLQISDLISQELMQR